VGLVLEQFLRSNLLLGQRALARRDPAQARQFFETVLSPPQNLGEAKHLLANWCDVFFWIGTAYAEEGQPEQAICAWQQAARQHGDFREMSVRSVSDKTFWAGMAYARLGQDNQAQQLFQKIYEYSLELEQQNPRIDYFATSLPAMLLFENDLRKQNQIEAKFLRSQALLGMERENDARALLGEVLQLDSNHAGAADLMEQLKWGWRGCVRTDYHEIESRRDG
jgi:tetratricopeptide (TPR) repeat protein